MELGNRLVAAHIHGKPKVTETDLLEVGISCGAPP
jgi:hypothetical protein